MGNGNCLAFVAETFTKRYVTLYISKRYDNIFIVDINCEQIVRNKF